MNLKYIRTAAAVLLLGIASSAMAQYTAFATHEKGYGEGAGETQAAAEAAAKAACERNVKSKGCTVKYTAVAIRYFGKDIPHTWKIGYDSYGTTNREIINYCLGLNKRCLNEQVLAAPGFFAIAQAEKTETAPLVSEGLGQFLSLEKAKGVAEATCEKKAGRPCTVIEFGVIKGRLRSEANREAPQPEELPWTRMSDEEVEKHLDADYKNGLLKCEQDPYTSPATRDRRLSRNALWALGCTYVE